MKITGKGQVTIPASLGKKHGLGPGANVEIVERPEGLLIIKTPQMSKGRRAIEILMQGGPIKGTTKEWLELTRGKG